MIFREDDPKAKQYPYMAEYTDFLKKMERPLLGREKEMKQLMAAMARPELSNVILLAEAGTGKANSVDTILPVADERGYIRLGDVKIGDKVFNEDGYPVDVIGVFPQGMLHAYEVVFTDGTSVVCNDEHLWAARTRSQHYDDKPYSVHTLRDMMDYGIVKVRKRSNRKDMNIKSWYVPRNKAVKRPAVKDLPILPYAMGALIGDGCLTGKKAFEFSSDDEFVVAKVADGIGAVGYEKSPHNYSWHFVAPDGCAGRSDKVYMSCEDVAAKMTGDNSAFGKKSIDRRVPEIYMLASESQRMELLRGLMDTDGTVTGTDGRVNASFSTNSQGLAKDVQKLANSLGYRATLRQEKRKRKRKNAEYSVYFMVEDEEAVNLFSLPRHIKWIEKHMRHNKKFHRIYDDVAIAEVRDLHRDEEMLCIYVDSPAHLFQITENHIVTHNTALVQGTMLKDTERAYLEVNLPKMIANLHNENEMADKLKSLFKEVEAYRNAEGREIVLFIDEFHQIVQLSSAAVEVLKPLLADSGTRGIRVIAATTYIEYQQHIASNLPLVERLQRINLPQPSKEVVVSILRDMAKRYGVESQFVGDSMFEAIYDYTNRYIPANAQPRKSILMLDSMIGWHRVDKRPIDMKLLADVIYETEGINIAFRVDATSIKSQLDKVVIAQQFASTAIESRLQICCADLNNKNKPMSSFLFTGSTGVGKRLDDDTKIPVYTPDGSLFYKRNGDLQVGDYVFNREGKPVKVTEVFHYKDCEMLEVELTDGRTILADPEHLWQYKSRFGNGAKTWKVADTQTLMQKNENKYYNEGRTAHNVKFVIPMNKPVQWDEMNYKTDPYVIGAAIGNGCLRDRAFGISSADEECIAHVSELIHASAYKKAKIAYTWTFDLGEDEERTHDNQKLYQTASVLSEVPELVGAYSHDKHIPEIYKHGSIEQRWNLIRGLFDTDGTISSDDRFNVSYSTVSKRLAYDIQDVLYSLGVSSSVNCHSRDGKSDEYDIHVKIGNKDKEQFFYISRKREIARKAAAFDAGKKRVKKFGDVIGIRDIRKTGIRRDATCIMVDDDEHLYQAGQYVVTHNTEMSKQLANILFEDERALVRMDMTEYALPESLERFRLELTQAVWTRPYCIILLDEIEKACAPVTRILLQVLDDGRLLDRNNREVTFKNAYIIVTTNAGSEIYKNIAQYNADDTGSGKMLEKYESLIRDSIKGTTGGGKFPPELLGRIDCLVPFQPLSEKTMGTICLMKLNKLRDEIMRKHRIKVEYEKRVLPYIVQDKLTTDSDAGGARGVVSRIEREVTTELSRYINAHPEMRTGGKTVYVCVEGELIAENKNRLESGAHIVISDHPITRNVDDNK